jgi:hypothetical protein
MSSAGQSPVTWYRGLIVKPGERPLARLEGVQDEGGVVMLRGLLAHPVPSFVRVGSTPESQVIGISVVVIRCTNAW